MAIVGRAKYTRARENSRRRFLRVASPRTFARARVYFARPTITIAKIRDYSQSTPLLPSFFLLFFSLFIVFVLLSVVWQSKKKIIIKIKKQSMSIPMSPSLLSCQHSLPPFCAPLLPLRCFSSNIFLYSLCFVMPVLLRFFWC